MKISLSPFTPKNWSRETLSIVPSRVSLLISIIRLNLVLTHGIRSECTALTNTLNRHTKYAANSNSTGNFNIIEAVDFDPLPCCCVKILSAA